MELLSKPLEELILAHRRVWVAFSGGMDSHVLLHLCAELRKCHPLQLRAVHVHHGLSSNADAWATHCENVCADLQVELMQKNIQVQPLASQSLEEVARHKRYAVLAELMGPQELLLTAHHQEDQAETVLLQLLRGAGPKGLAAMPLFKPFAQGYHARPLLNVSRADIKKYAMQHHLQWIEDESNVNSDYTRNFLRHEIIPIFKKRWPTVSKTLTRVAEHCGEAQELLTEIAQQDLITVQGQQANTLSVKKLLQLTPARQRQVVRVWLEKQQFAMPSAVKMRHIQQALLARNDKSPCVTWRGVELRRYQDELYALSPLVPHDATQNITWDLQKSLTISGVGVLHTKLLPGVGLRPEFNSVVVRFRQGGEHCRLPGRQCHHELKKLFQMWCVPPWQRDRIPLIYVGDVLVAVVGYFFDAEFAVFGQEEGYNFILSDGL
jgi:tRNA(Ile)-lysidine synthase